MVRARLAFLALAGSSLLTSGCASTQTSDCKSGGWFSRFSLCSKTKAQPAAGQAAASLPAGAMPTSDCQGENVIAEGDAPATFPQHGVSQEYATQNAYGVPSHLLPPNAVLTQPPSGSTTHPPVISTTPSTTGQPPRIVPVPQAQPMPYTPQ